MTEDAFGDLPQLLIIADDLTGALDAAGPFAAAGRRVRVATAPEHLQGALACGAEVVAVSTRSRDVPEQAARRLMSLVMAQLPGGVRLFKKIDSRLKGNIAAELDVMVPDRLLVAPAIPEFGRIVRGGQLTGFGVAQPIAIADVLGRHAAQADIPDCAKAGDLETALRGIVPGTLLVGSRSLAQALAGRAGRDEVGLQGPMTVAVGSTDPITLSQCEALQRACPGLRYLPAPAGVAAAGPRDGALVLLQAVPGAGASDGAEVARALARSLAALRVEDGALVLTGGATAEAVLDERRLGVLEVVGEALPGLPVSQAGGLKIITKSGGFGGADTLVKLARMARVGAPAETGGSA